MTKNKHLNATRTTKVHCTLCVCNVSLEVKQWRWPACRIFGATIGNALRPVRIVGGTFDFTNLCNGCLGHLVFRRLTTVSFAKRLWQPLRRRRIRNAPRARRGLSHVFSTCHCQSCCVNCAQKQCFYMVFAKPTCPGVFIYTPGHVPRSVNKHSWARCFREDGRDQLRHPKTRGQQCK